MSRQREPGTTFGNGRYVVLPDMNILDVYSNKITSQNIPNDPTVSKVNQGTPPPPDEGPDFQSMIDALMAGFAQNVTGLKDEFSQSMEAFKTQSEANLRSLREQTALDEKRRKEEIVLLQRRLKDRNKFREGANSSFGQGSILTGGADILGGGSGKTLIGA